MVIAFTQALLESRLQAKKNKEDLNITFLPKNNNKQSEDWFLIWEAMLPNCYVYESYWLMLMFFLPIRKASKTALDIFY